MKNVFQALFVAGLLASLMACPAGPPVITLQPRSQTVVVGQLATFSVTATGNEPLLYQWYKNGAAVTGASARTYTTATLSQTDSGSLYLVTVSNAAGSVSSCLATLTVVASGSPISGDPTCPSSPPGGSPPPPRPPGPPSPPSPPSPPGPPSPPTPPSPPPPPPPPGSEWKVPVKHWHATFKVTEVTMGTTSKTTKIVEASAEFEKVPDQRSIVSVSGNYTLNELYTDSFSFSCKTITTVGSGTILPGNGRVTFYPDDEYIPLQVIYYGFGASVGTETITYSNCPGKTPPPEITSHGALWFYMGPATTNYLTSPDLRSFSDRYTETTDGGTRTLVSEWSFTRTD